MSEESNTPLRVPLLRQRLMELILGPTKELIAEEIAPLKRRIAELERKVAEMEPGEDESPSQGGLEG